MRLEDLVFSLTGQRRYRVWNFNVFLPGGQSLARYVYEKENSVKIDADHKIRFSDGNPLNFDTNNLILVGKDDWIKARHIPRKFERDTQGHKVPDYVRRFIETLVEWGYNAEEIREEINDWKCYKQDKANERLQYDEIAWDKYI